MTKLSGAVRAVGALIVLLAAVIGAPILLWQWGRPLLFDRLPSWDELSASLWQQDTGGAAFLALLVVAGTVAWAVFTFCVVLDIAARFVGRSRTWHIPGLGLPQAAVSALLTVILTGGLMVGSVTAASASQPLSAALTATSTTATIAGSASSTAAALQSATPADGAAATQAWTSPHPVGQKTWTVARYDTLSSIAAATLGDWQLYPQLVQLNAGVPQPDGRALVDADTPLQIGWVLALPDGASVPAPAAVPTTAQTVTVQAGDTLSSIAQDTLGSADRYPELARDNGLSDPDQLEVGQIIQIPGQTAPSAVATPTQAPYETPADQVPADQSTAEQSTAEQPAAGQPPAVDDSAATAPSANENPAATEQQAPATPAPAVQAPPTAAEAGSAAGTAGSPGQDQLAPDTTAAAAAPDASPAPVPVADAGAQQTANGDQDTTDTDTDLAATGIGIGAIGAVLAGAVWLGLGLARRRRGRRRPTAKIPVTVGLDAARMERRLREQAATVDVLWMDHALRCAAALSRGRDTAELPDVTCVWLSGTELQLELATPVPAPAPFELVDSSWVLSAEAELPDLDISAAAPFPGLSTLGDQDGETLLVDLERLGSVTITGSADRTAALLRHLAVEYAFNGWADHLQITLVGWGAELVALNPDRLRHANSADDVITALRGRIADTAEAESEGHTTVLNGRIDESVDIDDAWVPEILLVDQTITDHESAELSRVLAQVSGGHRAAVAVIVRAPEAVDPSGAVIHITSDGRLTLPEVLGETQQITAAGMSQAQVQAIVESFDAVEVFRSPGPIRADETWSKDMDVTGALMSQSITIQAPATVDQADDDGAPVSADHLDDTDIGYQGTAAAGEDDLVDEGREPLEVDDQKPVGQNVVQLPSAAAHAALQAVLADDPELDADLQEWNHFPDGQFEIWQQELELMASADPGKELRARGGITSKDWVRRPRIGVLGEPVVLANGRMPTDRWGRFTEMCVYLALHKQVSADKFTDNLWPKGMTPTGETRRSDVSRCRSWMGTDPEGRKYLPDARNRPYALNRLLDLDLLRRLRKRADAKTTVGDTTGAMNDLTAALNLVRGPVLAESPRDAYSWLAVSDPADLRSAPFAVISTAHQLVELVLDAGELDLARWAADLAHLVHPDDDQPLVDLMRISHQAGDDAAARGWAATILQANRVELVEDLGNFETFVAVNEIFPKGLRAPTG